MHSVTIEMKVRYSILLIIMLLIGKTFTAISAPAYPNLVKVKQPDGTEISVFLKGDEKVHWMESEDGYSLLYDNSKTIVYATTDEKGDMIPSSVAVRDISLRTAATRQFLKETPRKLNYSTSQINTFNSIWKIVEKSTDSNSDLLRASVGEARAICALINFPDKPLVKTKDEFNNLMNQMGYSASGAKGSVKDYYLENSYGKLDMTITVAGPYTVSKNWAYYGENGDNGKDIPERIQEFAIEAARLTFTDPNINPADYDNNNNGFVDAFHIIYAGYGEEAAGDANCIWAHKFGFPTLTFGNKRIYEYSCSPELRGNTGSSIAHIGVICHELCHLFGAPDFYDTGENDFLGTGRWDLMASGNWNNGGACPAHINMYQKINLGWVTPVILNQPQTISGMPNSAMNPVAYRYNTSTSGEYYILENRQQTGFDQYVPGKGLLIYHVSITNTDIYLNTVNTKHPQKVYPVCASANTNPNGTPDSYGNINSTGCTFPGSRNKTSFTDYTVPSATSWNGTNTAKPITDITERNGTISFQFMEDQDNPYLPVVNLQSTFENENTLLLSWSKPSEDVTRYKVYRDNVLLITLMGKSNTSYSQRITDSGKYNYCVTAIYYNNESEPLCIEVVKSSETSFTPVKNSEEKFNIYPNPVNSGESIVIHCDPQGASTLSIFSITGKLLQQERVTEPVVHKKMDLEPGIYLMQIKNQLNTFVRKIIIK